MQPIPVMFDRWSDHWRRGAFLGLSVAAVTWVTRMPSLSQPLVYNHFADQRRLLDIPHFWNVVSNVPFAVIGLLGLTWLLRMRGRSEAFADAAERRAYIVFFLGELVTCLGSGYYHAAPSNETLMWDRLGLSLMLTSFFAIVVQEFVNVEWGRRALGPLVVLGLCSVLYWSWTESAGHGDLRPYLLVQFYPLLAIPFVIATFRSRYTHSEALLATWALYGVAKACEIYDAPIYAFIGLWSGHTLKHLVAAAASYLPLYGLQRRRPRAPA